MYAYLPYQCQMKDFSMFNLLKKKKQNCVMYNYPTNIALCKFLCSTICMLAYCFAEYSIFNNKL